MFSMLESVAVAAMDNVWSKKSGSYQLRAITSLLKMHYKGKHTTSITLVQDTRKGKSIVLQTVGAITCGVTLVLENTLSLGANQRSKFDDASQTHGSVIAYHLESLIDEANVKSLNLILANLQSDTNASIFLYSSPENFYNQSGQI